MKTSDVTPLESCSRAEIEQLCMRNLLGTSEERLFFKDLQSRFLLVSEGFLSGVAAGCSLEDLIGKTDFDLFSITHASEAYADEQHIIKTGESVATKIERETFHDKRDAWVSTTKHPLRDSNDEIIGTFGISLDVTAEVEAQEALAYQALHDSVTGLSNRAALMDRIPRALAGIERQPGRIAVVFIDLDDFKSVNDTLGHSAGDDVLSEVARRLRRVTRRSDTLARFGGDEFVLCIALTEDDDVRQICERIMKSLRAPLEGSHSVTITGSLGAVVTDNAGAEPTELLQQADLAMYSAKRSGRNHFEIYSPNIHGVVASSRSLAAELREALEQGDLFLVYQPLFRLCDGSMTGVEALVRWRHPERGLQAPSDFIPVAEKYGLIEQLDSYVLDEACRQLSVWTLEDPAWIGLAMSVNLSGHQIRDPGLVNRVLATLVRHKIEPSRLCLEITETAMIGELSEAHRVVDSLSEHGIRIALDDFGTGYSTLAHLQRFRADVLKIDRSFVSHLGRESRDQEIIAAVTAMAHALGMTVVGEGVETVTQRNQLGLVDCDEAQGYLFSPPLPPSEISRILCEGGITSAIAARDSPPSAFAAPVTAASAIAAPAVSRRRAKQAA